MFKKVLKKVKHRVVENMSSTTADALGLSRAILCNGLFILFKSNKWMNINNLDGLIKRLDDLERNEMLYKGLIEHCKKLLKSIMELSFTHKSINKLSSFHSLSNIKNFNFYSFWRYFLLNWSSWTTTKSKRII